MSHYILNKVNRRRCGLGRYTVRLMCTLCMIAGHDEEKQSKCQKQS